MKKENNKVLILLLIIFIITTVLAGGYIIYDKVLSKNDNTLEENVVKYNYDLTKRTNTQVITQGYIEIINDNKGDVYLTITGNLDNATEQIKNNLSTILKQFKTYSPSRYKDYTGTISEIKAIKLATEKVLTTYYVHMGNNNASYFIFIKENGTLSYLSYDDIIYKGQISLKNIDNLKNIVSIAENDYTMTPYAINLDGQEIDLHDYLK